MRVNTRASNEARLNPTFNIDVCNVEYIYFLLSGSRLNINMNDIQKSLGG